MLSVSSVAPDDLLRVFLSIPPIARWDALLHLSTSIGLHMYRKDIWIRNLKKKDCWRWKSANENLDALGNIFVLCLYRSQSICTGSVITKIITSLPSFTSTASVLYGDRYGLSWESCWVLFDCNMASRRLQISTLDQQQLINLFRSVSKNLTSSSLLELT